MATFDPTQTREVVTFLELSGYMYVGQSDVVVLFVHHKDGSRVLLPLKDYSLDSFERSCKEGACE